MASSISPVRGQRSILLPDRFGTSTTPTGMGSPTRRRPSSISARRDDDDSQADSSPRTTSDAVLLRCRDTIERLHSDVEEERQKRTKLQDQASACESELAAAKVDLAEEQARCREAESRCTRLERQLADMEHRMKSQKEAYEVSNSQLQQLKSESLQKAQEFFSQGLKLTELDSAAKRAEARAAKGQEEVTRLTAELRAAQSKVADLESQASRLQESVEGKAQEAERILRIGQEHEHRCEELQQEVDDLSADKQAIVEANQFELQEMALHQERLQAAWKEREIEVQRIMQERDDARDEVDSLHQEAESSRQQARRLAEEQRDLLDKCGRLEGEVSKMRRQAEEARRQAAEKSDEMERLERQRANHGTTVATLEQQVEEFRRQLRERSQELARHKADYQKVLQQLEEGKLAEDQQIRLVTSAKEAQKRASELTWRLEAANKEVEASRERCKDLEQLLQQREDKAKRGDVSSFNDVLARAHRHAEMLAKMQAELARKTVALSLEDQESLSSLKQKYEQKIAKLHQHLSEREAYERKLKGFIENEVDVLHQYNRELENYCKWRRGGFVEPPPSMPQMAPMPDKVGKRLMQNLRTLEERLM